MIDNRRRGARRLTLAIAGALELSALTGTYLTGTASASESTAAAAAHSMPLVAGTPCTITARSCVDLESREAWLLRNGKIVRGPAAIGSGGPGEETPIGHSLRVYLKDKDHRSE